MNKKLVILSGGLDSTVLLYWMIREQKIDPENIIAISFKLEETSDFINNFDPNNTLYQNNQIELKYAQKTTKKLNVKHHIIDLTYLNVILKHMRTSDKHNVNSTNKNKQATSMPFRNMIMMSNALAFGQVFEADQIFVGYQQQDQYGYWDTNMNFVNNINNIAKLNPDANNIEIVCPFVNLSKSDEIKIGLKYQVPWEDTWTCYNPIKQNDEIVSCGKCLSCKERLFNFEKLNIVDTQKYFKEEEN